MQLDYDLIETPENVKLERPLAGIGSRLIAGIIDNLILFLIYLVLFLIFLPLGLIGLFADAGSENYLEMIILGLLILTFFIVYWGYYAFFEWRTNGQSPGKKKMRIRVVKDTGGAITFPDIAIRNLMRIIDSLPTCYAVGGICMFFSRKTQRLGDLAAGTIVTTEAILDYSALSDKKKKNTQNLDSQELTAERLRTTGLKPQEFQILQNYHLRRNELTLESREQLLPKLIGPILEHRGIEPTAKTLEELERYVDFFVAKCLVSENSELASLESQEENIDTGKIS